MLIDGYKLNPSYYSLRGAVYDLQNKTRCVSAFSAAATPLGRGIFALCFGEPTGSVLYVGGMQGTDTLSTLLLLYFCQRLAYSVDSGERLAGVDVAAALDKRGLIVLPCLNPDGLSINLGGAREAFCKATLVEGMMDGLPWSANSEGIELSMNFAAGFDMVKGGASPAPRGFAGSSPFCTDESAACAGLVKALEVGRCYHFTKGTPEIKCRYPGHTPENIPLMCGILSSAYPPESEQQVLADGSLGGWVQSATGQPAFEIAADERTLFSDELLEAMVLGLIL